MKTKLILGGVATIAVIIGEVWLAAAPQAPEQQQSGPPQARVVIPAHSSSTVATAITPTVGTPTTTPATIVVSTPTTVTVTVAIAPTPLSNGVNLLRIGATGTQPTILGVMHDDGQNGDVIAGDNIYTLQVNLDEAIAGQIQLQISAAFKGALKRLLSQVTTIAVWSNFSDSGLGVSLSYPPSLVIASQDNSGLTFKTSPTLSLSTGAFDDSSTEATSVESGYSVYLQVIPYSQPFSLDDWISANYATEDVASVDSISVSGRPARLIVLSPDSSNSSPTIIVEGTANLYKFSYRSAFLSSSADQAGLDAFDALVSSVDVTR